MTAALLEIDEKKAYLTKSEVERRRKMMDADVWLFIRIVTEHGYGYIERFHRPMAYLIAGDAERLAACLNSPRHVSQITIDLRADLKRREIDWNTKRGRRQLAKLLRRINDREARKIGKTSVGLDVILACTSANPNLTVGIASKSDPVAQDRMCSVIGKTMLTDAYAMYYGDRLMPTNPEKSITKKWIDMNGRGFSDEHTIDARGINSQWTAHHYAWIYADDIVGTESGEASTQDALRWIAAINFISRMEGLGGSRHIFRGTIYGAKDDNSVLIADGSFLSLNIPIWKKNVPHTLDNIAIEGVPVLPEWQPLEAIREERRHTLANPTLGAISWLRNNELSADEPGAFQFSNELLKRAKFVWVERKRQKGQGFETYNVMRRYLWNGDGTPKLDPNLTITEPCLCWMACKNKNHAFKEFDPLRLPRRMAVDQAYTRNGGDKFGVRCGAQDPDGFVYILKGAGGKGYNLMVPLIPYVFNMWGGAANPPQKLGIESNSAQAVTADWMKRDNAFRFLARRIVKLSPGQTEKQIRIFNNLYANLKMGRVLLDPDDHERDVDYLAYDPTVPDPEDSILDGDAMVVTMFGIPAAEYSDEERRLDEIRSEREYWANVDPVTRIMLDDWAQYAN